MFLGAVQLFHKYKQDNEHMQSVKQGSVFSNETCLTLCIMVITSSPLRHTRMYTSKYHNI